MTQQLVVITSDAKLINDYLSKGWKLAFAPISQHVATGSTYSTLEGRFLFVLESQ